jgi:hypothetical protein
MTSGDALSMVTSTSSVNMLPYVTALKIKQDTKEILKSVIEARQISLLKSILINQILVMQDRVVKI